MSSVETFLRSEIGLDAASIGPTAIERVTRLRMKSLGLKKAEDYLRLLKSSSAERQELVEAVVITETWFFRDRDSFTAFTRLALQWFSDNAAGPLRVLSVPCASGEEPYSLAMSLLDAGIPPQQFVIDAVDVSARTIERATRAVYGKNSFRGKDLSFRDRHFRQTKDGYALSTAVGSCVRLHLDNLLNDTFLSEREAYHFIFCRNVLIYFDRATQARALGTLSGKMASSGILFVGPAEMPIFLDNGFVSANLPMAFACHKAGQAISFLRTTHPVRAAKSSPTLPPHNPPAAPGRQTIPKTSQGKGLTHATSSPLPNGEAALATADLEAARQLADAGKLKEAAEICEMHLHRHGPSAQIYYLLGLVHDSSGDPRAAEYYRKALYLEPNHYEALWHMSLLLRKKGENTEASAFQRRAERTQKKS